MANKISKSTAYIIDCLAEGEIAGPANNNDWYKSSYFQETQVVSDTDVSNFDGVTIVGRNGTFDDANALNDFNTGDTLQKEELLNVPLTNAGGAISRSITDDEVDRLNITFSFPIGLVVVYDSGKQYGLSIKLKVTLTPSGGSETTALEETVSQKAFSEFRQQYEIKNISSYGAFPITIKCYRLTEDYVNNSKGSYNADSNWYSYTEIKEVKLQYRNRAVVGTELKAEDFGDNIPNRIWKIKGRLINYPSNYNPTTRVYTGVWNGNFSYGYCNNPAWVVYDLLINKRYGVGLNPDKIDKWTLYSIGVYCDGDVTYTEAQRQPDGTYSDVDVVQTRYTFNGVISDKEQALAAINHFCSVFFGFPMWSTGLVTFSQDAPGSITRIASQANVKNGFFEYSGTSRRQRTTAVKVGWNDPDNFGKRDTIILEDTEGMNKYGYQPFDFFAIGCSNRNEAILRGKYALYTNLNQTELVTFTGGIEWMDALPGEIIGVQDQDYANETWSGRIKGSTTTSITIDAPITIAAATYTLYVQQNATNVATKTLTNSPGVTSVLTWSGALTAAPQVGNVWVVSSTTLAIRSFRIMSVKEIEKNEFQISGYEYDPNKYSLVENNLYIEPPIPTTTSVGALTPPTNILVEAYSYLDGDSSNRKYAMRIGWTASSDPRTQYYELQYKLNDGLLINLDITSDTSYNWLDVPAGSYDIYVKAVSLTAQSPWLIYPDFVMIEVTGDPNAPTNLRTFDGGDIFSGKDCTVLWDAPIDSTSIYENYIDSSGNIIAVYSGNAGKIKQYKVEVYDTGTLTLIRTFLTASEEEREYTYFYADNLTDNNGIPIRALTFKIYSISLSDDISTAITLAVSNPVPDMSSSLPVVTPRQGYLDLSWAAISDFDMAYYNIYFGTVNPPNTLIEKIYHPNTFHQIFNVEYGTTYYIQIQPYDGFGSGVKSQVPAGATPLLISGVNVDVELIDSITKTATVSYSGNIESLYDRVFNSGGITFTPAADQYIQYAYNLENYFDRVAIWSANANTRVYIGLSIDGTTWTYYKALGTHELDTDKQLDLATNLSDAKTNYWQLAAGFNTALFPNNYSAKYVRLFFTNTNATTIYEFVPSRLLISELAAIENLSSISANIGSITSGVIQSSDYSGTEGMQIDFNNKNITIQKAGDVKFSYVGSTGALTMKGSITLVSPIPSGSVSGLAATATSSDFSAITGTTKPSNNATVGAIWGTNLSSIPATLGAPSGSGLFLSSGYMGYYTSGAFKTYIDASGNMKLGEPSTGPGLSWNQGLGSLTINGSITITNTIPAGSISGLAATATSSDFSAITGGTKPANNATVGAIWGTNLSSIPATLGTPAGSGLFLSATNMGYYTGGLWKTYIDSSGNMVLGDPAGTAGLSWNQGAASLTIKGSITITNTIPAGSISGLAATATSSDFSAITGATKPANNATVGAIWGSNLSGIPATLGAPSGAGLYLSSTYMGYYDGGAWKTYTDSSGNMVLGNPAGSAGLSWNQGAGTLTIKGNITLIGGLNASEITAGVLNVDRFGNGTIDTIKMVANSITKHSLTNVAAATSMPAANTSYLILTSSSVVIATACSVKINAGATFVPGGVTASSFNCVLYRDATLLAAGLTSTNLTLPVPHKNGGITLTYSEYLAAGSYTFYLYASATGLTNSAINKWVEVTEYKK